MNENVPCGTILPHPQPSHLKRREKVLSIIEKLYNIDRLF
jgi:hypothetical protein